MRYGGQFPQGEGGSAESTSSGEEGVARGREQAFPYGELRRGHLFNVTPTRTLHGGLR